LRGGGLNLVANENGVPVRDLSWVSAHDLDASSPLLENDSGEAGYPSAIGGWLSQSFENQPGWCVS